MLTRSFTPPRLRTEQRRTRRFPVVLPVDLSTREGRERLVTVDVGRHGLFVRTENPPPERQVVRLAVHLPDGTVSTTACVSRRVPAGPGKQAGMGLHLFALSADARERWDAFLQEQAGMPPSPVRVCGAHGADVPTFFVKVRDRARLAAFFEENLKLGAMTLTTPVLKDVGTAVHLVVVHPESLQEFLVAGVVADVFRERPKRMVIRFHGPTPGQLQAFAHFLETGVVPTVEEVEPAPPRAATRPPVPEDGVDVDLGLGEDALLDSDAFFQWDDPADAIPVVVGQAEEPVDPALEVVSLASTVERVGGDAGMETDAVSGTVEPATQWLERTSRRQQWDDGYPGRRTLEAAPAQPSGHSTEGLERMVAVLEQEVEALRRQLGDARAEAERARQEVARWHARAEARESPVVTPSLDGTPVGC